MAGVEPKITGRWQPANVSTVPKGPHEIIDTASLDRINASMKLITFGVKATAIVQQMVTEKGIGWTTAWRDYKVAQEELAKLSQLERETVFGQALDYWNTMIQMGLNIKGQDGKTTAEGMKISMAAASRRDDIFGLTDHSKGIQDAPPPQQATIEYTEKTRARIEEWARTTARSRASRGKP